MSARAHPRLIGAFVVLGVGLVLTAVVLLGAGTLFTRRDRFTVFFPSSVQGLRAGAPVTFRGIPIGQVAEVRGFLTDQGAAIQVEVVFEVWRDRIQQAAGAQPLARLSAPELAEFFVRRGVKAEMLSQSLLTGQKLIELDFHTGTPGRYTGLPTRYPELPTVPSTLERLGTELGNRLDDVVAKAAEFPVDELRSMVIDTRRMLNGLNAVLDSGSLARAADGIGSSTRGLEKTLASVDVAVKDLSEATRDLRGEMKSTASHAREVLARADGSLSSLDEGARSANRLTPDLVRTLDEVSQAAAALRTLLEYLQQHPEALVSGKPARGSR